MVREYIFPSQDALTLHSTRLGYRSSHTLCYLLTPPFARCPENLEVSHFGSILHRIRGKLLNEVLLSGDDSFKFWKAANEVPAILFQASKIQKSDSWLVAFAYSSASTYKRLGIRNLTQSEHRHCFFALVGNFHLA
ncbi:hypothetical protein PSP6_630017 [Paraburkholderia tropica]|nr:hypothetical protein PSP6_630017 [Paraburkholderia tropica]